MALDFPAPTAVGQVHSHGSLKYVWDGAKWKAYSDPSDAGVPSSGGTFAGNVSFDENVIIKGDSTNGSGKLTLNCENNSHGVHIKGPPHSASATYTLTLPNNTGSTGQALTTDGNGSLSFVDIALDIGALTELP